MKIMILIHQMNSLTEKKSKIFNKQQMENKFNDINYKKNEIKKFFEQVFIDIHEECLKDNNDERIDFSINFLHNMIVLEKSIMSEIDEVNSKIIQIKRYLEEAQNLKTLM